MSSWHEPRREPSDLRGFIAIAIALPAIFFGLYFALDFLLLQIAGLVA